MAKTSAKTAAAERKSTISELTELFKTLDTESLMILLVTAARLNDLENPGEVEDEETPETPEDDDDFDDADDADTSEDDDDFDDADDSDDADADDDDFDDADDVDTLQDDDDADADDDDFDDEEPEPVVTRKPSGTRKPAAKKPEPKPAEPKHEEVDMQAFRTLIPANYDYASAKTAELRDKLKGIGFDLKTLPDRKDPEMYKRAVRYIRNMTHKEGSFEKYSARCEKAGLKILPGKGKTSPTQKAQMSIVTLMNRGDIAFPSK